MRRAALLLLALAATGVAPSGADFTASSSSPTTITAAADFNTVAVTLDAVGTPLIGSVPLSATASSNRGIASVRFQQAHTGTGDWVDVCTASAAPYGCSWDTTLVADGSYDVRALATDDAGYTRTHARLARIVDNHTLSVTLTDPGAMGGTETLTATAANATGALVELKVQHRAPGAPTWTDACPPGATTPFTCNLDTRPLPEGGRELRAVARDSAGHVVQSTVITRTVDNTPPTATANIPPTATGSVSVSAEASDSGSGIASVTFQALYMGTWYPVCVDSAAPFTCTADSAQVPDGNYSIRVVTKDNAGVQTIGEAFPITVDNPPRPTELTTFNAATSGMLDSGDWVRLTWSEPIDPATVLAGWDGASQPVRVRVRNVGTADELDFLSTGGTALGLASSLRLRADFVSADATFDATMTRSGAAITVTLGTNLSGTLLTAAGAAMAWTPSAAAKDLSGKPSRTTTIGDVGGADVDF